MSESKPTPEAAFGRLPLEGAPPVARQSRFHGGTGMSMGYPHPALEAGHG